MVGEMSDTVSTVTTGADESPQVASGPMDKRTARCYVKLTGGQFQAFERDGVWFLYTPDQGGPPAQATGSRSTDG
jgi:hypothetical protein